jgi:branched-chain amino acid transport system ATP-binding protein
MMLKVEDLVAGYAGITALKGVTLEVEKAEIVALLGANGAGKSTTLRAVSGLVRPRSGRIEFEGRRIDRLKPYEIARMGVVQCPEGRRLFANLTVTENLEMGAYNRRDRKGVLADFERVAASFPVLAERRSQKGGTLSGGEQQMLAMARSLMARPKILLLDEPSLGLAPILTERIFETIASIRREGVTILVVEQNARTALEIADRAYVLETGSVVISGRAKDLIEDPAIVAAYLGGARGAGAGEQVSK